MDTRKLVAAYITAQNDYEAANREYRAAMNRMFKCPIWRDSFKPKQHVCQYITLCWYTREWAQNTYNAFLPMHDPVNWRP